MISDVGSRLFAHGAGPQATPGVYSGTNFNIGDPLRLIELGSGTTLVTTASAAG